MMPIALELFKDTVKAETLKKPRGIAEDDNSDVKESNRSVIGLSF